MRLKSSYRRYRRQLRLPLSIFKKSISDLWADGCFTQAAAISYYLVVSIFPMLLLLIGVAGFFLEPQEIREKVLGWLSGYFPSGTRVVFRDNIEAIIDARESISIFSSLSLLWSSTLMFDAINEAVNAAWGMRGQVRFLTEKLKSLLLIALIVFAAAVSIFLTAQITLIFRFRSLLATLPGMEWPLRLGHKALSLTGTFIPFLLSVCAFGLAYRLLPRTRVTIRDVWPAALGAAVLWEISKRGFVLYLTDYANYAKVYGSISAVLVLMLWAYVSSVILAWGAELTAEIWRVRWKDRY